jgi:glycosyltransferase involved in cell wall biosynthesis
MTLQYVLITPARNEAGFIENTIKAVIAQTVLPVRWVIVSDGSTDGTDEIVRRYMMDRPWIDFLQLPEKRERSFATKVLAFKAGYERLGGLAYEVIGNLDADITFPADYFEYLIGQFEEIPRLGVAGTHYVEGDLHSFGDSYMSIDHVNGGCQMFRKKCFEDVGGYVPIRGGGIDWVAVTTARMKGWITRSFADRVFHHHRKIGTAGTNEWISRFRYGKKDYFLGGHPLWQLFRGLFQMTKRPYVIGGFLLLSGYMWAWLTRTERPVSRQLVRFHRNEQMTRLRSLVRVRCGLHTQDRLNSARPR